MLLPSFAWLRWGGVAVTRRPAFAAAKPLRLRAGRRKGREPWAPLSFVTHDHPAPYVRAPAGLTVAMIEPWRSGSTVVRVAAGMLIWLSTSLAPAP